MRNRLPARRLLITISIVMLLIPAFFGCKNPLLTEIEQTVDVAVTPPEILSIYPLNIEQDVAINLQTISVTFSKPINSASVTSATFFVTAANDDPVSGVANVENDTITFTPSTNLSVGTTYTVTIDGIRDTDGNSISEIFTWSFTTGIDGDTVAPVINDVIINGTDTWTTSREVTLTIDGEDNFGVAQMNVSNSNSFSESNWQTFQGSLSWTLTEGDGPKTVYIKLKDGSGNSSTNTGTGFISLDTTPPALSAFLLDGGKSGTRESVVDIDIISVDQEGGSGTAGYRLRTAGEAWPDWQTLTDGNVHITDVALTVSTDETQVFEVQISDVAGNVSAVGTSEITLDLTAPTVYVNTTDLSDPDDTSPNPGQSVPQNTTLVKVVFAEEMNPSTFTINNFYLLQGLTKISDQFAFSDGNTTVTFLSITLEQNSNYTVFIGSDVTDVAGNELGSDYSYVFSTDFALDTTPPAGQIVLDLTNPDINATGLVDVTLQIKASDDFNSVYGVKIWGDSDGSLPMFEDQAVWETYTENANNGSTDYMDYTVFKTVQWTLDASAGASGDKYIFYRFMDTAANVSTVPGRLKINLDQTDPTLSDVVIDEGSGYSYSNNPGQTVNITLDAFDQHSGLKDMWVSETDYTGNWTNPDVTDWSPLVTGFPLTGEGEHQIYVQVRDFVDRVSATLSQVVNLDLTEPVITFTEGDILEVNSIRQQSGIFIDPDPGTAAYQIPSGIASYLWEKESGPGTVTFYSDSGGTTPDAMVALPWVEADTDGSYELKVTVTDNAGNSNFNSIPLIWDTLPPEDLGLMMVYDQSGYITDSTNTGIGYTNSAQPWVEWPDSTGADFYIFFPGPPSSIPDWDDPSLDWEDPATYEPFNFERVNNPTVTAPPPNGAGGNDGEVRLRVTAWDNAGNRSSEKYVDFFIDTLSPVITNDGQLFHTAVPLVIDYTGGDGTVSDPVDPNSNPGSGIQSVRWDKVNPADPVTFDNNDFSASYNPEVKATGTGVEVAYDITLTATDNAGNETVAYFTFLWDTLGPNAPDVFAPPETPDSSPTWVWESGGNGGTGYYRYAFTDKDGVIYPYTGSVTTFTAPDQGEGQYLLKLSVEEQDAVGNWSVAVEQVINVDTTNITPPYITAPGLTNNARPTWDWTSGAGADPTATYQYRLDLDAWSADTSQTSFTPAGDLSHGTHTLYVQEKYNTFWRESNKTINVDLVAPDPPTVYDGYPVSGITNDTTPTWYWTPGTGDGIRQYQYRFYDPGTGWTAWSAETTATGYTHTPALTDGNTYTLEVRERDQAGNWSSVGSHSVTIDTVLPGITGYFINSNDGINTGDNPPYTTTRTVTLNISWNDNPTHMRFKDSGGSYTGWYSIAGTKSWTVPVGDGYKYVYVQLKDAAGNYSTEVSDLIYLDETDPSVVYFNIANNAVTSTSTSVTIYSNVSGANYMRMKNGVSGSWSAWNTYSTTRSWTLSSGNGAKKVFVEYKDYAGNVVSSADSIFYGTPVVQYATKGEYTGGTIHLYYDSYASETGSSNTYYIYYATSAGGSKIFKGSTTFPTEYTMTGMGQGVLYYVFVRVYNPDVGDYTNYSAYAVGFSSDITVIYDDADTTDTALANSIKTLLEDSDFPAGYPSYISGTMPVWKVTLMPENLISNSWYESDDRYIIYGDPVIITPSATLAYSYPTRARNILHRSYNLNSSLPSTTYGKSGIVAMGYGGALFLYRANLSWAGWGYATTGLNFYSQYPVDIGYANGGAISETGVLMYQWTTTSNVWSYPLTSTVFVGGTTPTHDTQVQISYTNLADPTDPYTKRYSVYRSTDTNPVYGYLLGKDSYSSNPHYFPVVQQGRFMQFGFPTLTDRPYTGKVYFINLIARMDNY